MSNLFNVSHMLESYSPDIVKTLPLITYLSESLSILKETDDQVFDETSKLYSSVLEADSRKAENVKFAEFFKEYQSIINKYILKIQELASEFSINVETFADANKDILDNNRTDDVVSSIVYKGAKYAHLLDPEVPDVEPYKAFKKEFAFIGKLMQDLGPIGTEDQKAQIIATVCNNLSKEINDDWLEKVIKKITDCDDCGKDGYARAIYKTFVPDPSVDMSIDIGLVKQSRLDISNYRGYIDCISTSVNQFTDGLSKIASEVGSMFFRNQDHKLPIKTDVDGVEDNTYRLNDYSFNQMNMFITTKISQITELCNLYMVAIGIKMDCIMKYLRQCKDIIDTAANGIDNTPNTVSNPQEDNDIPEKYDDDIQDFNSDNDISDDTEDKDIVQDNSDSEIERECYLFEAIMYDKERAITKYIQQQTMYEALIEESDNIIKEAIEDRVKNIGSFIDSIINQIKKLMQTMKDSMTKNYTPVIESVNNNKKAILGVKIPDGWTIDRIDDTPLQSISLPKFDVADIPDMGDKAKYYIKKYPFLKNSKIDQNANARSAKDIILSSIKGKENDKYTGTDLANSVKFIITGYSAIAKNIERMSNDLSTQKSAAERISTNESSLNLENTLKMYFEADEADVPKDQQKATNKTEAAKSYFRLNSEMIAALMNINSMLMKKHLNFVSKAANIAGITISNPSVGKDDNSTNNNNTDNNQNR